jgi:hypothetical protein
MTSNVFESGGGCLVLGVLFMLLVLCVWVSASIVVVFCTC